MVLSINGASLGVVDSHTLCPKTVRVKPLWHRLLGFLGRPASESGSLLYMSRGRGFAHGATAVAATPPDCLELHALRIASAVLNTRGRVIAA
jgi:hypothetical protein